MGYLVMRDTGAIQVNVDETTKELTYTSDLGASNPTAGFINLKAFAMTFESEVDVDVSALLTEKLPRITTGNNKAIPITFQCVYDRKSVNGTGAINLSNDGIVSSCMYLDKWAESKSIVLLYFMPNADTDTIDSVEYDYDQCRDFYYSLLRVINNNKWNKAWLSKTNNKYSGAMDYKGCVIPLAINKVSMKEEAYSYKVEVSIDCYLITKEE